MPDPGHGGSGGSAPASCKFGNMELSKGGQDVLTQSGRSPTVWLCCSTSRACCGWIGSYAGRQHGCPQAVRLDCCHCSEDRASDETGCEALVVAVLAPCSSVRLCAQNGVQLSPVHVLLPSVCCTAQCARLMLRAWVLFHHGGRIHQGQQASSGGGGTAVTMHASASASGI